MRNNILKIGGAMAAMLAASSSLFAAAPMTIVVVDPPGVGFNDPHPAEPVGGNSGATVGEQRLNAVRYAAGIWSSKLDSPVPIRVRASFTRLNCNAETVLAGGARPGNAYSFPPATPEVIPNVWYPVALANKLSGTVLEPDDEEIVAYFNSDLGRPDCAAGRFWYYGLDTHTPEDGINLVAITLHEFAHGLGFLPYADLDNGSRIEGRGDVYTQYVLDLSSGKMWGEMSDEERAVSIRNSGRVVWNGINVRKDVSKVLRPGTPMLRVTEPASIAGDLTVGTADFGSPLAWPGVSGEVALALNRAEAAGSSTSNACSPLLNASAVAGRIALVDRGVCTFVEKALNVQAAGALGMVVVDNVQQGSPNPMTGDDPGITIPTVLIRLSDGNRLKGALAAAQRLSVGLLADPRVYSGADPEGRPLLYAPDPASGYTAIGHWDPIAAPNQLMEPSIEDDVAQTLEPPHDLTLSLLRDLGWFSDFDGVPDGVDQCPGSDRSATLVLRGCNTFVRNATFPTGCRISDYYKPCTEGSSGNFVSCVDSVTKDLQKTEAIGPLESVLIQACALRSTLP